MRAQTQPPLPSPTALTAPVISSSAQTPSSPLQQLSAIALANKQISLIDRTLEKMGVHSNAIVAQEKTLNELAQVIPA